MKIVARGKGLKPYSYKIGYARIDKTDDGIVFCKLNTDKSQYIVEFELRREREILYEILKEKFGV